MAKLSQFETICEHGNVELTCPVCDRIRMSTEIKSLKAELKLVHTESKEKIKALRDKVRAKNKTITDLEGQLHKISYEDKPLRASLNSLTAEYGKLKRKLKRAENKK